MYPDLRRTPRPEAGKRHAGFTLLEIMISILVVAILAAIAVPSYGDHVTRGRLQAGVALLKANRERLEQNYSDNRSYALADGSCALVAYTDPDSGFAYACVVSNAGQRYVITATGTGPVAGFRYSIDEAGIEQTLILKAGWSSATLPANRFIVRKE